MTPITFPEANRVFGPPDGFTQAQVQSVPAFVGAILGGPLDGSDAVVVAWKPEPEEIQAIVEGSPIFLMSIGGLPPHALSVRGQFIMTERK